jgi:hypothetical protein
MTTDNFCFYLQNRLIQTSQTGGQQYSNTSPIQQGYPIITNVEAGNTTEGSPILTHRLTTHARDKRYSLFYHEEKEVL